MFCSPQYESFHSTRYADHFLSCPTPAVQLPGPMESNSNLRLEGDQDIELELRSKGG
jgi:hypothetical protein